MPAIRATASTFRYVDEDGFKWRFVPTGDIIEIGETENVFSRSVFENPFGRRDRKSVQGARIIAGFDVGLKPRWTMKQVVDLVFDLRRNQVERAIGGGHAKRSMTGGDVGITFVAQKGVWQSVDIKKAHVENGVQIIIFNTISEKSRDFVNDMEQLAEDIATKLEQAVVILEHQRSGSVVETVEVFKR